MPQAVRECDVRAIWAGLMVMDAFDEVDGPFVEGFPPFDGKLPVPAVAETLRAGKAPLAPAAAAQFFPQYSKLANFGFLWHCYGPGSATSR